MPTVAELEKLQALIGQLLPLADIQRGELIRAQDWNTVVTALIEVARATLSADATETVPPHEHPDQVSAGWLAPGLRSLVERGPMADPVAVARVQEIERRLAGLAGRIENGSSEVGDLRLKLGDAITKQLALVNDVTTAKRTIEGVGDAREDVLALRQSLDSVRGDVRSALEMARNLTVDGQPANLQGLADRLKSVEGLRDRLTTPDGQLLDAASLEHRLTDLTNTLVTQQQLDDALKSRTGKLSAEERNKLRDGLRTELTESLTESNERHREAIRAETAERLAGVDAQIARAVGEAVPGARDAALAAIRPELQAAVAAADAAAQARTESRLAEMQQSLVSAVGAQIDDVRRGVADAVRAEVDNRIPAAVAELRSAVDRLSRRTDTLEDRVRTRDTDITGIGTRLEAVTLAEEAARTRMRTEIVADLDTRLQQTAAALDQRFGQMAAETNSRIEAASTASRDGLRAEARAIATEVSRSQIQETATALRAEMHTVARDELAGMDDRIPALITAQVRAALADLPQVVDTQVRAALGDVQSLVDTRMTAAVEQIRAEAGARVDAAFAALSPQVAALVRESVNAQLPDMVRGAVTSAAPAMIREQVNAQLATPGNVNRLAEALRPSVTEIVNSRINR